MTEQHKEIQGLVFNIQRFSLHDGPGIRTLVFLKGCPLSCIWCANPEGLTLKNQVLYDKKKCKSCGACLACPEGAVYEENGFFLINQKLCNGCGVCAAVCRYGAKSMTNKPMTAREVVRICERDRAFYRNGVGGLTLGGGEPLFQSAFALEILRLAKENSLHTAIETSACVKTGVFLAAIDLCDIAYIDIKAIDDSLHKKITGTSNKLIIKNIKSADAHIAKTGKNNIKLRIPLIPECNDNIENLKMTGEFIASLNGSYPVEILPFHNFGESKYEKLGFSYPFADWGNMKKTEATFAGEILSDMGLSVSINTH